MRRYTHRTRVDVSRARAWRAAGQRFGAVARWAPGLASSSMVDGGEPGVGARRVCTPQAPLLGMDEIVEEVTVWTPPHRLGFRVVAAPFPLARMASTWSFEACGDETEVTIELEVGVRGGRWLDPLADLVWHLKLQTVVEDGAEAFRAHVERIAPDQASAPRGRAGTVRL